MRYGASSTATRLLRGLVAAGALVGVPCAADAQGLTTSNAMALGRQYHQASAALEAPDASPGARIAALRTLADTTEELAQRLRDVRFVQPGAEAAYRSRSGVGFEGAAERAARTRERCLEEVRSAHALDNNARSCLRGPPTLGNPPVYFALPAPQPFASARGGGTEASAYYTRVENQLRANPDDRELRLNLAAMELETGDYYTAASTLSRLHGDYAADLTTAVALARSGRTQQADRLLNELVRREPNRPEAHFNLGQLLSDSRAHDSRVPHRALTTRALIHYRAYLCTRDHAVLASPADAHRHAAEQAVDLMSALHGEPPWQPGQPLPHPIVPSLLLPSDMASSRSHSVAPSCPSLIATARDSAVRLTPAPVSPRTHHRTQRQAH